MPLLIRFAAALACGLALLAAPAPHAIAQTVLDFPTWQAEEPGVSRGSAFNAPG